MSTDKKDKLDKLVEYLHANGRKMSNFAFEFS